MARWRPDSTIRIEGETAYVSLTRGFESSIDASDVPLVAGYHWSVQIGARGHAYAYRIEGGKHIAMHRVIAGAGKGQMVDHIDGDGLNNQRSNIRLCNMTQNMANKAVERRNKLGLKGVSQSYKKYRAKINNAGHGIYLGTYATPEEAAAAYKGAARVLWGDFAKE